MQGLQPLLAFSETAKHGGFAAAARALGTDPSTLAKAVGRLETSLGLRLFHRTTRQVRLTGDGEELFERCQRVLSELDELQSAAAGNRTQISGALRVNMPIVYGRKVILPVMANLIKKHPGLTLDVRLTDAYVDLVRDSIDVAIRVGSLSDSSLVATRIDGQQLILVAAPQYLRQHGTPANIKDLAQHQHVVFRLPTSGRDRPQQFRVRGRAQTLEPARSNRFDDGEAMVRAAVLGLGLTQVPDYMAEDELADGRLVEVLPQLRPAVMPIYAVVPGKRMVPARVRALLDALKDLPGRTDRPQH